MSGPCIYQIIHLFEGRPRLLEAHLAALDKASRTLFGRAYTPDLHQIEARITALAAAANYPRELSGFVRLTLTAAGEEQLQPAGVSLYDGFALRSVTPDAITWTGELPWEISCEAWDAVEQLARLQAERAGGQVALRCDARGICRTADSAPLFAVRGRCVLNATSPGSVMRDTTIRAICSLGLDYRPEEFTFEHLSSFDELFYADHRGITALAHANGTPYMSLTAGRVAKALEALFRKI